MTNQHGRNDLADKNIVTVFGGTGFVGRRIVSRLVDKGIDVRAVSRHPRKNKLDNRADQRPFQQIEADILDPSSIVAAVAGSRAVVNAVSLYVERGKETFERVHVEAAAALATASRDAGVERFIQISGIGSDSKSRSNYIRARGCGEDVVKTAFPGAVIVRPAVMAGPDDAFITTIVRLVRLLPIYPLFGRGHSAATGSCRGCGRSREPPGLWAEYHGCIDLRVRRSAHLFVSGTRPGGRHSTQGASQAGARALRGMEHIGDCCGVSSRGATHAQPSRSHAS